MRFSSTLIFVKCVFLAASGAFAASGLEDVHLRAVQRTEAEARRVEMVVRPTGDFTKPEPFEANQAGAATVRVTP